MTSIKNTTDYDDSFSNVDIKKEALKQALDIRKFEIELYWKRATYFWSLIAAAFAGYFALTNNEDKLLPLLISCIGLVLSVGWFKVNRGSKYWQSNWERHVDCLENTIMGPLYKTTINRNEYSIYKFWEGYPYSVSRINQLISLFVVLIWCGLVVKSFPETIIPSYISNFSHWILVTITFLFIISLFTLGVGGSSEGKTRNINFISNQLSTDDEK